MTYKSFIDVLSTTMYSNAEQQYQSLSIRH